MGKIENDKMRKLKNEHFIKAFEYVAQCLNMTQGALADAVGSKSSYISNYRNGTRPVTEEIIENLISISAQKPGLQIFSEYLYGFSDIMLLDNVTDEEMADAKMRHENPDYNAMRENIKKEGPRSLPQAFDFSLMIEHAVKSATAYADQTIATLKSQLADKDKMLADKDDLITTLKSRIRDLELTIANNSLSDIEHYPFHIGAADGENEQQRINHI